MRTRLWTIVVAVGAVACGNGGGEWADSTTDERQEAVPPGGDAASDARGALSDPQIASLVTLINGTEAAAAKAVQPKLAAPEVRTYAGQLVVDHRRLMAELPALDGPSVPAPQVASLNAIFHSQAAMLGTLPAGLPFDATFLGIQIADHAMAIDSLRRWHDAARDPALKRAIAGAVPVMESHLQRAQSLYAMLDQRADLGRPGPPDTTVSTTAPGPRTLPADTASDAAAGGHEHDGGHQRQE